MRNMPLVLLIQCHWQLGSHAQNAADILRTTWLADWQYLEVSVACAVSTESHNRGGSAEVAA
jgi:hypothetical protein